MTSSVLQPVLVGDFCLVPIAGITGKLIQFGQLLNGDGFNSYEHAEIYIGQVGPDAPYGMTLAAYPNGARTVPLPAPPEQLTTALWSTGHFDISVEARNLIVKNAIDLIGTPYSPADYFALAAHRLHLPIPFLKKYISDSGHMICSQLVDFVYMKSGIHLFSDDRWPGYVTPGDLAKLLGA
jgi:hypothetical protein